MREVLETRFYEVSPTPFPAYQDSTVSAERSFKGLADMSGLDLRDLIEANEKGSLKDLLVEENESVLMLMLDKEDWVFLKKSDI
ncbi:MAG: hypothetical protein CM15mV130_280 [Caudoviricetes sp.]|nr:MAG: hypothetical protein CM15mV130_280 [Caudoviricetes sp.]